MTIKDLNPMLIKELIKGDCISRGLAGVRPATAVLLRFKNYTLWRNLDPVLIEESEQIPASPFARERIIEMLQMMFCR